MNFTSNIYLQYNNPDSKPKHNHNRVDVINPHRLMRMHNPGSSYQFPSHLESIPKTTASRNQPNRRAVPSRRTHADPAAARINKRVNKAIGRGAQISLPRMQMCIGLAGLAPRKKARVTHARVTRPRLCEARNKAARCRLN